MRTPIDACTKWLVIQPYLFSKKLLRFGNLCVSLQRNSGQTHNNVMNQYTMEPKYSIHTSLSEEEFIRFNRYLIHQNKRSMTILILSTLPVLAFAIDHFIRGVNLPIAVGRWTKDDRRRTKDDGRYFVHSEEVVSRFSYIVYRHSYQERPLPHALAPSGHHPPPHLLPRRAGRLHHANQTAAQPINGPKQDMSRLRLRPVG